MTIVSLGDGVFSVSLVRMFVGLCVVMQRDVVAVCGCTTCLASILDDL